MLVVPAAAVIQSLGEQIKVRQQVIATATIYFKRFYARLCFFLQAICYFVAVLLSVIIHGGNSPGKPGRVRENEKS